MLDRLGEIAETDADYVTDSQWPDVVRAAQHCLPALILAGGWEHSDTDARLYTEERAEGRIPTVDRPATRRNVIRAVAALADADYQRRAWTGASEDPVTGSLSACLHTLTHDAGVLPDPAGAVGRVLLPGDEIDRLTVLGAKLRAAPAPGSTRPHTAIWSDVVDAALHCLPALVIAGAWIGDDPGSPTRPA